MDIAAVIPTYLPSQAGQVHRLREVLVRSDVSPLIVANSRGALAKMVTGDAQGLGRTINAGANIGYGAACNMAIEGADADWFLLINDDVDLSDDSLREAIHIIRGRAGEPGVIGFLNDEMRLAPLHRRRTTFAQVAMLNKAVARLGWTRLGSTYDASARTGLPQPIPLPPHAQFSFAFVAVARDAHLRIGGFDTGYRMYFEDSDYLRRCAHVGVPIWWARLDFGHARSASTRVTARDTIPVMAASCVRFLEATGPSWEARPLVLTALLIRLALATSADLAQRARRRPRRGDVVGTARAVRDVLLGRHSPMPAWD